MRILERARERQRKLFEYSGGEAATPLRESNTKAASTSAISSPPQDFAEVQKAKRKYVISDSDLSLKPAADSASLTGTISEGNLPKLVRQNSKTRISSHMPGSPQLQLKTLNIQKENFNMEIKLSSSENVRIEVELQEESDTDDEGKENVLTHGQIADDEASGGQPTIRAGAKKRLERLGKLYAGGEDAGISSPIHRTEATFLAEDDSSKKLTKPRNNVVESDNNNTKGRKGLGGLAALAKDINQWEDNLSSTKKESHEPKTSPQKRSWKPPAPRPPISSHSTENVPCKSSTPRTTKSQAPKPPIDVGIKANVVAETLKVATPARSPTKSKSNDSIIETPKQLNLDPALMKTLESQGFTRSTSNTRLVYNYDAQNYNNIKTAEITTPTKIGKNINTNDCILEESEPEEPEVAVLKSIPHTSITKITETKSSQETPRSPVKSNIKGSAIANRAALFESASSPSKNNNNKDPALLSVSERKALFEKNKGAAPVPKAPISMAAPLNTEKVTPKSQNNGAKPAIVSVSSTKPGKSTSTSSLNEVLKSPKKGEKYGSTSSVNLIKSPAKYPAPRPPIRPNDKVDSSAYRVAPGESGGIASKMAALFQNKSTISQQQIESSIREQRQKEMDVLLNRFRKNKPTIQNEEALHSESESESDNDEVTETTAMISEKAAQIIKKSEEIPPPPPPPPGPSGKKRRSGGRRFSREDSPKVAAVLDEVKRIKVSSKPGRLYPCLSDIEAVTETETEHNTATPSPNDSSYEDNYCYESDAEAAETSFGREILETVCKNQSPQKRAIFDESTESDVSDVLDDMDDYLDEALAYDAADKSGPTPPKQGRSISPVNVAAQPSNSFHYKNFSPRKDSPHKNNSSGNDFKTPSKVVPPRKSDELPAYVVDGDDVLPLTHTVSFYRRQQTQGSKTPVRQIIRQPVIEESSENSTSSITSTTENNEVQIKIHDMLEEMTRQQTIISQTSQALNLCYSTPEFTGSTEQVEAEKVLLLATHRRAAAQREMERLSVLRTLHSENRHTENIPLEKGSLTISNIVLPLKREYVRALNATGGKGHHVVCLFKCAEQVHPTKLVSTVATNDRNPNLEFSVPGTIRLNNIYSNFTVQFEVYCLQAQEEILPHEVKYHIGNKKSNNKLTPKKMKPDSRLIRPPKESPGGPQAVRSPTFALMGYVVFSIQAINRKNWTLNNTPSMSPLEGIVEMRVKCELSMSVEHHGFLTMFEDVSGFGAWHRRWCLLKGHVLSYWKYPEEERKKAPIDSIDLTNCITQLVGPVRRDICARLHTILLETTRPAQPQDKDSLVMECTGDTTIIRHLLSADTKEERVEWCTMFNKSLTAIKMSKHSK